MSFEIEAIPVMKPNSRDTSEFKAFCKALAALSVGTSFTVPAALYQSHYRLAVTVIENVYDIQLSGKRDKVTGDWRVGRTA